MSYYVITAPVEQTVEVKRSRFMGFIHPVQLRSEAMQILQQYIADFPDAAHHCWAYVIGDPNSGGLLACSDDGEPAGTAGKPMLNVLQHKKLSDLIVVVVRYFGGVKLGTGGLVRAYSETAQACVDVAKQSGLLALQEKRVTCCLHFAYPYEASIRQLLKNFSADIISATYTETVDIKVSIVDANLEALGGQAANLCHGDFTLVADDTI